MQTAQERVSVIGGRVRAVNEESEYTHWACDSVNKVVQRARSVIKLQNERTLPREF